MCEKLKLRNCVDVRLFFLKNYYSQLWFCVFLCVFRQNFLCVLRVVLPVPSVHIRSLSFRRRRVCLFVLFVCLFCLFVLFVCFVCLFVVLFVCLVYWLGFSNICNVCYIFPCQFISSHTHTHTHTHNLCPSTGVRSLLEELKAHVVFVTARPQFVSGVTYRTVRDRYKVKDAVVLFGQLRDSLLVPFKPVSLLLKFMLHLRYCFCVYWDFWCVHDFLIFLLLPEGCCQLHDRETEIQPLLGILSNVSRMFVHVVWRQRTRRY